MQGRKVEFSTRDVADLMGFDGGRRNQTALRLMRSAGIARKRRHIGGGIRYYCTREDLKTHLHHVWVEQVAREM